MSQAEHFSVLLQESLQHLIVDKDGFYIDGTFGRGGHSGELLKQLGDGGKLLAIDKDLQAIEVAAERFGDDQRFEIAHASFADMAELASARDMHGKVDGVLLDLGVSSPQLDQAERGFSFSNDGPLDMRMDTSQGESAADWINRADEADIIKVLREFGEERFAKRMARAIGEQREKTPFTRTKQLAEVVAQANPAWEKGKHPATRAFQAIRIYINNELGDLQAALDQALEVLKPGGRLVVISFHSLEDRIVKRFIRRQEKGRELPPGMPIMDVDLGKTMFSIGKAAKATPDEVEENVRSRSAVMRVAEKL